MNKQNKRKQTNKQKQKPNSQTAFKFVMQISQKYVLL